MAHLTPIRDAAGGIIGLRPKGDESQFAATLADTMTVVGEAPAAEAPRPADVRSLAMIVAGLIAALILVAGLNLLQQPAANDQPPRSAPTAAPVLPTATRAPTVTPVPTSVPTAVPEPPTAVVIIQQAPPVQCWTVTLDVTDQRGIPIGIAEGYSCESQDAARANAETRAEQVRATHEKR